MSAQAILLSEIIINNQYKLNSHIEVLNLQNSGQKMQKIFTEALNYIKNLPNQSRPGNPQISNDDKLAFYGLFKQVTTGTNNTKAPSKLKIIEKYKWDAWKRLGKMSKEDAMRTYVQKLTKINPTWNVKPKL